MFCVDTVDTWPRLDRDRILINPRSLEESEAVRTDELSYVPQTNCR